MKIVKTILRRLGFLLLLVVALAVGALAVLTLTEKGRENLAGLISTMASSEGSSVQVIGISGIWSGALHVDSVVLSDSEGAWLAARGVAVDWSPWALLSNAFRAQSVHADRVEFARLPKSQAKSGEGGGLPVSLDITRLDFPQIMLGPSLAGEIAQVSAEGSLRAEAEPLAIATDLKIERRDGRQGTLDAKIDFAPAKDRLAVEVHGSEPAGGIIANLLRLPGAPPVEIAVSGTGPAANWSIAGSFSVDGEVITKVAGKRQLTDKGNRIEAKGEGAFERFVPEIVRPLLAGQSTFDVAGTLGANNAVGVEHAQLQSAAITVNARGAIDPASASDLTVEVVARDKPARLPFGEGGAIALDIQHLTLRAFGAGETPAIDASASIAKVVTPQAELTGVEAKLHSDAFDILNLAGPLALSATVQTGGSVDDTIAGLLAGSPTIDMQGVLSHDGVKIAKGTVTTDTATIGVSGDVSFSDGTLALDIDADLLAALVPEVARASLGERISLSATVGRNGSGAVSIEPFAMKSGPVEATGRIAYAPEALDVAIKGSFGDVARLSPDVVGLASFELSARGAPATPEISATVSSPKLTVVGRPIETLSVTAKTAIGAPTVEISLSGNAAGKPLTGAGVLGFVGGERRVDGLAFTLGENKITGALTFDDEFVPAGTLAFSLPDIGSLASLADEQVAGAVDGTATFSRVDGVPQVKIEAKAGSITRDTLSVSGAEIAAIVADYLTVPKISGTVKAGSVGSGSTTANDVALELKRDGEWTNFSGGATVSGIQAKAQGRLSLAGDTTTVELASLSASGAGLEGALPAATTIAIKSAGADRDITLNFVPGGAPASFTIGEGTDAVRLTLANLALRASGPADRPVIDASASIGKLVTPQAELDGINLKLHSDGLDTAAMAGPLTLSASAASGGSANETIAGLLAGALKADITAALTPDSVKIEKAAIASDAVNAAASGAVSLADGSLKLDVTAELLSTLLPEAARSALDKKVSVTATISRDTSGAVTLDPVKIASGAFDAAGDVAYAPDALTVHLKGGFADVSKLSPDTSGAIGFEIGATGSPEAPDITATISSDKFAAAGREVTGLSVSASGKFDPANPAASVSIKGNVAGQALAGQADLKTTDGRRRIDGLTLTLGDNRISGDLAFDAAFTPEGTLTLALPDIGPLAALALDKADGAVNGTIRFSRTDGAPQVAIDAKAASVVRGDLSVKDAEVTAAIANYLIAPAISGKVKALSVTSGGTLIRDIDVSLMRDGSWTGFSGGATIDDIVAQATGRVALSGDSTVIELASAAARTRGLSPVLATPTTITVKDGTASLDRLAVALSGGRIEITGTAGQQLNLNVTLAGLPASVINAFAPGTGAAGTLSGSARIAGAAANPNVGYTLDWKGAQTIQTLDAGFGAMTIASSGTFDAGVLKFSANLGDGSGLGLKGGGSVDVGRSALSLDFSGQVPFGFLTKRLAAQGLALSGTSSVNLTVRGGFANPVVGGSITTSGSRLVDARSGIAVNDIAADIAIASGVATIRKLTGTLSSGGSVSGSGTVGIDATKGFPADLSVKVGDARYTDGRIVTANLGGDVTLKGPLASQAQLSGTVNLAKTVITIPERLPASIATLGVKHRNAPAAVREQSAAIQPPSAAGNSGGGLTLDLTVNAPQQIYVRGRGLDAELGGSIKLTGALSSPRAVGLFTLRRGRLSVLAKRLDFTRGTLGFSGSLIPTLDFAADSKASDATVTVGVSGLATNPKFSFTSSPSLPEDEVLARLVFGRSMSNLSPLQIAQLADAAAQLAGAGGSTSLLNTLRGKIGVDDLDVTTDDQGNTAVSAGKYLNDRTYVTIQKGDKAGSGKATIDLDVGRGVKLRGEAAEDGKAKGGIFFEREY